jgi:hypothetical protein
VPGNHLDEPLTLEDLKGGVGVWLVHSDLSGDLPGLEAVLAEVVHQQIDDLLRTGHRGCGLGVAGRFAPTGEPHNCSSATARSCVALAVSLRVGSI